MIDFSTRLMTLIGAIFSGLVFIITVVVCIVCIYCICKRNKQRRATGSTVVQPTNTNIVYGKFRGNKVIHVCESGRYKCFITHSSVILALLFVKVYTQ